MKNHKYDTQLRRINTGYLNINVNISEKLRVYHRFTVRGIYRIRCKLGGLSHQKEKIIGIFITGTA